MALLTSRWKCRCRTSVGAAGPPGDGLFRAVQKLGLKLERHSPPVDTIVVDHLEKTATSN
jgi:uncharacterized protein (TIGR03435 family)